MSIEIDIEPEPRVQLSRREFIARAGIATATLGCCSGIGLASSGGGLTSCPIAVFSKIYQELKLNYAEAAAVTAEAGLDGIDCPIRDGGEVLPERVEEDLPKYAEELRKHGRKIYLVTSGITSSKSPHAEAVLKASKALGVKFYRLGFYKADKVRGFSTQAKEVRADLKEIAALSQQMGMCGLFQNHNGSLGADLGELKQLVDGFDPNQLGVAFDIGHALLVHGDDWRKHFEILKPHIRIIYIKDAKHGGAWTRFGEGDIPRTGYFRLLKEMNYHEPISLHIEFDWSQKGKSKDRAMLVKVLQESKDVLKGWLSV